MTPPRHQGPLLRRWLRPFGWALRGWWILLRTQRHARVHAVATLAVVTLGGWLQVTREDWCWLLLAIALVWSAEAFNSAVEALADRVTCDHDPLIGAAKDLAAGAVLFAALGAAAIGWLRLAQPLSEKLFGAS